MDYKVHDTKMAAVASVTDPKYDDGHEWDTGVIDSENLLDFSKVKGGETYKDVNVSPESTLTQEEVVQLLRKYKNIITDKPCDTILETNKKCANRFDTNPYETVPDTIWHERLSRWHAEGRWGRAS